MGYCLVEGKAPAFKRRGDYDLVEVAKLIACKQVSIAPRPRPI
jgi:hypothetical protein